MKHIPYISVDQMREIDRAMIEDYGIALIQMMENAGRNLATLSRTRFLSGDVREKYIVIMAGIGGNGGGGLVSARHLHNWGGDVFGVTSKPKTQYIDTTNHQLLILEKMGVPIMTVAEFLEMEIAIAPELIIDSLIGYSLSGDPRGDIAKLISWANAQESPILSLDIPSGLDADNGEIRNPCITATATMTLALPKVGLVAPDGDDRIGELFLADISVPPSLYEKMGIESNFDSVFPQHQIIQIR